MNRPPGAPFGPPARPQPKTARELLQNRRDFETVHIGELKTVLAPIIAAFRTDVGRLDDEIKELRAELGREREARLTEAAMHADDHLSDEADRWETRLRAWWHRLHHILWRHR